MEQDDAGDLEDHKTSVWIKTTQEIWNITKKNHIVDQDDTMHLDDCQDDSVRIKTTQGIWKTTKNIQCDQDDTKDSMDQ